MSSASLSDDHAMARERALSSFQMDGRDPREAEYLAALLTALDDRRLSRHERDSIVSLSRTLGFTATDRRRLHTEFLRQTTLTTLVSGPLTIESILDLGKLAGLLGLDPKEVESAADYATQAVNQLTVAWGDAAATIPAESDEGGGMKSWLSTISATTENLRSKLSVKTLQNQASAAGSALSAAVTVATQIIAASYEVRCKKCRKITSHRIAVGRSFPIRQWLDVAWKARSLCPTGFVSNAALLAITDRQLLQDTGRSLLPSLTCKTCGGEADRWDSAQVLVSVVRSDPTRLLPFTTSPSTSGPACGS